MTSIKIRFSPSSVILKEGTVHYQVTHYCKVRHIRTGYKLPPSKWISASGETNVSAGSGEGRKSYLVALENQIDRDPFRMKKRINWLSQEDTPFTVGRTIELYIAPEGNCIFPLYGKKLLVELKQIGKMRIAGTYQNTLSGFERFRGHRGDTPLDEMDPNQVITYESWLKGASICPNTSSYYICNSRAIYNRVVSEGLVVQWNPFKHVYTGIDKAKKWAASLSVIRRTRNLGLNKKPLISAKGIFMLSFYIREMSFVDMAFLKKKDLQSGILTHRRKKTGRWLFIKWEKPMQELIDKYNVSETSYLLPIIQNDGVGEWHQYQNEVHHINRNLRHIGKQIGSDTLLTTYVACHAWASAAQSRNASLPAISEALGHDPERTTRIYLAPLDASIVDTANSLILMSI